VDQVEGHLGLVATTVSSAATAVATAVAISVSVAASAATTVATAAAAITAVTSTVAANSGATAAATTTTPFGSAVNLYSATVELGLIQAADSLIGMIGARVGNESEAAAATGLAVADNDGVFNLTKLLKLASQGIVVRCPGQATDEKFNRHDFELTHGMGEGEREKRKEKGLVKGLGEGKRKEP